MEEEGVILERGVRTGLLITQHRINRREVAKCLLDLILRLWVKSEATFRCPAVLGFHLNGRSRFKIGREEFVLQPGVIRLPLLLRKHHFLLSDDAWDPPASRDGPLFFRMKMKWNLALLPPLPLKVSRVLTSSLFTSLRHKNGSLRHLFGRQCSGHRMHLVISVAITSSADQGWRFRPWWRPSAPITTGALWQQVLWWKNGTFNLNGRHQCSLVQSSAAQSHKRRPRLILGSVSSCVFWASSADGGVRSPSIMLNKTHLYWFLGAICLVRIPFWWPHSDSCHPSLVAFVQFAAFFNGFGIRCCVFQC